jgi:hypothetical protein
MATRYIVLEQAAPNEDGLADGWIERQTLDASGSQDAIAQTLRALETPYGGTFVAVPLRSWHPLAVRPDTRTVLRFGEDAQEPQEPTTPPEPETRGVVE